MKFLRRFSKVVCLLLLASASLRAQQVTVQIGQNFTGSTYDNGSGTGNTSGLPPDSNGSIGPNHFVEFINGEFAVYKKTNGLNIKRIADLTFWSHAGLFIGPNTAVTDPRVVYDPLCQRWFATMVDADASVADPTTRANDFLFAVSATSDPTGTWRGFLFQADPDNGYFADFPTLGMDSNAVYISGDFFSSNSPVGPGLLSIPKADLLLNPPSIDNRTWFGVMDYAVRGQVLQPVMCFDGTSSGNIVAAGNAGMDSIPYSNLVCFAVQNSATTNATLTDPVNLNVLPYEVPYNSDMDTPLFTVTQPDDTAQLEANDARFSARVYGAGGVLYAVHNPELDGHIAIRWYRINAANRALLESGTLADPNQDLFFPAIAANAYGTVVIGYNACGLSNNVSCYAMAGQTVNGVTTFGSPVTLQTGATSYHGDDELYDELLGLPPYSRWGDYNTLSQDPSDATRFWSIIMFPSDAANNDVYSTQITEIITAVPPQLAILKTATNITLSWPKFDTGFTLQGSTNLALSTAWTNVTQTPVTNGNLISVAVSFSGKQQVFRLKK